MITTQNRKQSKKYRFWKGDVFEVLRVKDKEVGIVNRTLPLKRQIEAFNHLAGYK